VIEIVEARFSERNTKRLWNFSDRRPVQGSMLSAEPQVVQRELPIRLPDSATRTRWFSDRGSVVEDGNERLVFVGGVLIGRFDVGDVGARNVLLVNLTANEGQRGGRLANAFGVHENTVRNIKKRYADGGIEALVRIPKPQGRRPTLNSRQRRLLERMFERGMSVSDVVPHADARYGVKRTTVYKIWRGCRDRIAARQDSASIDAEGVMPKVLTQNELEVGEQSAVDASSEAIVASEEPESVAIEADVRVDGGEHSSSVAGAQATATTEAGGGDVMAVEGMPECESFDDGNEVELTHEDPRDAPLQVGTTHNVQHVGTWIMLAALSNLGLYDVIARMAKAQQISVRGLRLAVDAFVAALSIGERSAEGVRRLATPSSDVLLRAKSAPSAPWVRAVLARVSSACAHVQDAMAKVYLSVASRADLAVFYVDNHMRPYTGKETLRKGWRMQDKRVRPGASDYYVHDVDGRPVIRVTEPSHGSLTYFLLPIAKMLRGALGLGTQVVLAFDRGGAFPAAMAELRDAGVHFVTYERKPYAMLASTLFEPEHVVKISDEIYTMYENRLANLGKGRGRVRRISVLTPDGRQINLLAVSDLPAETLLAIMLGRWRQENGFKHGNERWGINQLDGRTVTEYAPDTVIPNPARTRLDAALRIAKKLEGEARNALARLDDSADDARRQKPQRKLDQALQDQADLLAQRPHVPKRIEVQHSELSRDLVHHTLEYKGLLDAIRIACANVESELAATIGPMLPRPREAKKVLANLFAAPGTVRVTQRSAIVTLAPAATNGERDAIHELLEHLDDQNLVLPGDAHGRKLRLSLSK
jgi:transposase